MSGRSRLAGDKKALRVRGVAWHRLGCRLEAERLASAGAVGDRLQLRVRRLVTKRKDTSDEREAIELQAA